MMSAADRWSLPRLTVLDRDAGEGAPGDRREAGRAAALQAAPRIALFGNFGTGNTGNESSLAAMIGSLRRIRPDARLTCICYAPDVVAADHGIAASPLRWQGFRHPAWALLNRVLLRVPAEVVRIARMVGTLRRVDVMILPGTGTLDDFGTDPFEWPFDLFKWCVAARLCGVRVGFVSVGAGPIQTPLSRWFMKAAARTARYRSYRDELSKAFMARIGLDTRGDRVFPDLVFSLDRPSCADAPEASDDRPCVGVGIMSYRGWRQGGETASPVYRRYLAKMQRFVLWLRDRGYRVRLLGGDERDMAAHQDFLAMLRAADAGGVRLDRWLSAEPTGTLDQLIGQIAASKVVVATRFHNVLCALMLAKPTISIGYARKNDALMQEMGVGGYCQHIDALDVDRLIAQFEALTAGSTLREGLRRQTERQREALRQQERLLAAWLP
jgi:polysaccharide pyruvyl transferase WcaK-like protein